jgi:hypothetical protein
VILTGTKVGELTSWSEGFDELLFAIEGVSAGKRETMNDD